jgi:glycosyltransferase involved in cell wall biosynthesis
MTGIFPVQDRAIPLPRLAYLTGEYPAVSHTFILREVEALRRIGFHVQTCSVRGTGVEHHQGPAEKSAAQTTFYILRAARRGAEILRAQAAMWRSPRRYAKALALGWRTRPAGVRGAIYQLFYFAEATILARFLRAQNIDHLHNHFADSSANVAMLCSALSGIPFSYTLHGPAELYAPAYWNLRAKTRAARFVVCISHFCRSQAMYFSDPQDWSKLRIVHCGVEPDLYAADPARRSQGQGAHFVFVGRLAAIKGVRVLLAAFTEVQQRLPKARLTLVGDGPDRAELERLAAQMGVAVEFMGYRSQAEVADILAGADVFVLPSFAEGLPVVLMEALASSVPVIATQVAGVSELVEEGQSGYLVPPGDAASLADRMYQAGCDPQARARMGEAGRARVRAEFDSSQEAARLAGLFCGRAQGGGADPRPRPFVPAQEV